MSQPRTCHGCVCERFIVLRAVIYVVCARCLNFPRRNSTKFTALGSFIFVLCRTYLAPFLLTLTHSGESLGSHVRYGVCSENGLIASEFAVDNPVALVRDDCRNDRTKVKVVQLYQNRNLTLSSLVMIPRDGFNYIISVSPTEVKGRKIGQFWPLKLARSLVVYLRKVPQGPPKVTRDYEVFEHINSSYAQLSLYLSNSQ